MDPSGSGIVCKGEMHYIARATKMELPGRAVIPNYRDLDTPLMKNRI